MMFQADAAFALELIALGIGFWVLLKTRNIEAGNLKGFGSFIGYFIIVLAFLTILCTGYYTVRYWEDGHFAKADEGQMVMMQQMHRMQGCDYNMKAGKMGMHGDQCSKMMGQGHNEEKCSMMKGEMGSMMDDESNMKNNAKHHPEMMDNR